MATEAQADRDRSVRLLPVLTIDGPAGAGKSTAARIAAERLGWPFMDTGAMYRAITYTVLLAGENPRSTSPGAIEALLERTRLTVRLDEHNTYVEIDGEDVTDRIRTPEVTAAIGPIADHTAVRQKLAHIQRNLGVGCPLVTEGRDQGTAVFPDARFKIFLTASVDERARRRHADYRAQGRTVSETKVRHELSQRDAEDRQRPVGALKPAPDALVVDTTGLSLVDVVDRIIAYVREVERTDRATSAPEPTSR